MSNQKGFSIISVLMAFSIIVVVGSGAYLTKKVLLDEKAPKTATEQKTEITTSATTTNSAVVTTTTEKKTDAPKTNTSGTSAKKEMPAQIINCGANVDCFIEASKQCKVAKADLTFGPFDLFGILITSTDHLEIKGPVDAKTCIFYIEYSKVEVKYSSQLVAKMQGQGLTDEQIKQAEQESNHSSNATVGSSGTCKFSTGALTDMLSRWKKGNTSTTDFDVADCTGTMFENQGISTYKLERECWWSDDCEAGFSCIDKKCVSNEIFKGFEPCQKVCNQGICSFGVCQQACTNCESGNFVCLRSSEPVQDNLCVECLSDFDCKTGYTCNQFKCAKTN